MIILVNALNHSFAMSHVAGQCCCCDFLFGLEKILNIINGEVIEISLFTIFFRDWIHSIELKEEAC
jgi:hypothetical protein